MRMVDIVRKLIGPVSPVGETNEDNRRYENLQELTQLVDFLMGDIQRVSIHKNRPESSMNRAGKFAYEFLKEITRAGE